MKCEDKQIWRQTNVKMNEVYKMKSEHERSEYECSRNTSVNE